MPIPSNSRIAPVLAIAFAALLAGCAGGGQGGFGSPRGTNVYYDYSFAGTEVGYMEQFGPVPVYVSRSPAMSENEIRSVVASMTGSSATGRLQFVPAAAARTAGYSVVLGFGQAASGVNYCPGRGDLSVAPAAGAQIFGVFCLGDRLRSTATVEQGPGAVLGLTTLLFSPDLDPSRRRPRQGEN